MQMKWQIIQEMWSSNSVGLIAQTCVGSKDIIHGNTGRSKLSAANGCDELKSEYIKGKKSRPMK